MTGVAEVLVGKIAKGTIRPASCIATRTPSISAAILKACRTYCLHWGSFMHSQHVHCMCFCLTCCGPWIVGGDLTSSLATYLWLRQVKRAVSAQRYVSLVMATIQLNRGFRGVTSVHGAKGERAKKDRKRGVSQDSPACSTRTGNFKDTSRARNQLYTSNTSQAYTSQLSQPWRLSPPVPLCRQIFVLQRRRVEVGKASYLPSLRGRSRLAAAAALRRWR